METTGASVNYLSKEKKLIASVMDSVKDFLDVFTRKGGDAEKGGGRRKFEDQNAYNTVISSLVSKKSDAEKLTKTHIFCTHFCAQVFHALTYFHACTGLFPFQIIVEQYWSSCTPMNAVEYIDNTDKVPAIIDLGTCPETGVRISI